MGGKECASLIKGIDPSLPLFVASGYADDPVLADPCAYGFSGRLAKPFIRADLAAELERCGKRCEEGPGFGAPENAKPACGA
jgi:hypothetical protein